VFNGQALSEGFHIFFLKAVFVFDSVSVSVRNALDYRPSSSSYPCVNSRVEHIKTYAIVLVRTERAGSF
jgi:hypothetical protein